MVERRQGEVRCQIAGRNLKVGADLTREQINAILGIATNGFFVFAPFPASDSFASFLLGQSVQFFQGGGDINRGLRKWVGALASIVNKAQKE